MLDLIKEAKENKHGIVFEQYQLPDITWQDVLNFIYDESIINDNRSISLEKKVKAYDNHVVLDSIGNIQIQNHMWLAPQTNNLFNRFKGVSELLYKLNNGVDNSYCEYFNQGNHNCESDWHFQGIRISLSNRLVNDHHDPHDIFYWQIVGTSFWKIDGGITYTLSPGDLFYLPLENSHEVWCDGPRAGLLIDNLN